MLPLATRIHLEQPLTDRRRTPRHAIALPISGESRAVIENLSESGLALRTDAPLAVGSAFDIELPVAGTVAAHVLWSEDELIGCEFAQPIGKAAVSAARLQSPFELASAEATPVAVTAAMVMVPRHGLAMGVMLAFAAVAAMFVAALLTAPFAVL